MGMGKKGKKKTCCLPVDNVMACCKVESLITVDERGQMVLPKEIRGKANIKPGDKLAIVSWEREGKICCISLIKSEDFAGMVKGLLGPMMQEIIQK